MDHWHWEPTRCTRYGCDGRTPEMLIAMGPISGVVNVARELIGHFEIDPDEHDGLLLEVEQAIGDQMLDTMREILAERRIPIPAETDLLPIPTI
jgi:hypothetical protein